MNTSDLNVESVSPPRPNIVHKFTINKRVNMETFQPETGIEVEVKMDGAPVFTKQVCWFAVESLYDLKAFGLVDEFRKFLVENMN